jgi:SAM-dependent methyltransferase
MRELLERNRLRINEELASHDSRKYFSTATYADSIVTIPALRAHLHGKLIDIGCGDMPFKALIEELVIQYDSIDIERRVSDVKYVGNIQDMNMIDNDRYDSALCLEVLEHVQDPFKAISEIHRILKKGGKLVCSVPHLSRLHEEPNDYYRYTKYGLRYLFENSGFHVISIEPSGGIFCFLGHQISTLFLCPIWHIPFVKDIAFWINKWIFVKGLFTLDKLFDKKKVFALGYTCVVEKF